MVRGRCDRCCDDSLCAGRTQDFGRRSQRGAGGADVVEQPDDARWPGASTQSKGRADEALGPIPTSLSGPRPTIEETPRPHSREMSGYGPGQQLTLIEATVTPMGHGGRHPGELVDALCSEQLGQTAGQGVESVAMVGVLEALYQLRADPLVCHQGNRPIDARQWGQRRGRLQSGDAPVTGRRTDRQTDRARGRQEHDVERTDDLRHRASWDVPVSCRRVSRRPSAL